jgi:hypothetical protein
MNSVLAFIGGLVLGWWLGPAFLDISQKVWEEIKHWWWYRK